MKHVLACAVAACAATAAAAAAAPTVPPAYRGALPPWHQQGEVTYLSGGATPLEADAVKRAAQEYPLELVFRERDGNAARTLRDMPVTITDARGKVVFDGPSAGPYFLASLPDGRYRVTTQWEGWTFSRAVEIGAARQRVVFDWKRPAGEVANG